MGETASHHVHKNYSYNSWVEEITGGSENVPKEIQFSVSVNGTPYTLFVRADAHDNLAPPLVLDDYKHLLKLVGDKMKGW